MNALRTSILLCGLLLIAGCGFNTHGNRRSEASIVTRFAELRQHVGKPVTLVGTARTGDGAKSARLDMRGGTVEVPAYEWDADHIGQPVMISGTLFDDPPPSRGAQRIYRLGEVHSESKWSR